MSEARTHLSRRTLAKGAAWSAPVVVAGGLAPMAAASPKVCISVDIGADACKLPPQQYKMTLCLTSSCANVTRITIVSLLNGSKKKLTPDYFTGQTVDLPYCFPPDTIYDSDSTANALYLTYTFIPSPGADPIQQTSEFATPVRQCPTPTTAAPAPVQQSGPTTQSVPEPTESASTPEPTSTQSASPSP